MGGPEHSASVSGKFVARIYEKVSEHHYRGYPVAKCSLSVLSKSSGPFRFQIRKMFAGCAAHADPSKDFFQKRDGKAASLMAERSSRPHVGHRAERKYTRGFLSAAPERTSRSP